MSGCAASLAVGSFGILRCDRAAGHAGLHLHQAIWWAATDNRQVGSDGLTLNASRAVTRQEGTGA